MSRKRDEFYWRGPSGDGWSRRENVARPVDTSPDAGNCQSTDDRIQESIYERFARDLDIDAATIKVRVLNGEVTLAGTVESGQNMLLAEEIASSVSGVRQVNNQIAEEIPKLP
jgi:osmotically-inducible protein OsmY